MFNLVLSIISIALVAALAIASIYYVGSQVENQRARADAAGAINNSEQIIGAINFYRTDRAGRMPAQIGDLVTAGYLSDIPPGDWAFGENSVTLSVQDERGCRLVNALYNGHNFVYVGEVGETRSYLDGEVTITNPDKGCYAVGDAGGEESDD
ncbi:hypothetical protein J2T57_001318 [Natronocella acetinitrilica]|uniref:Uncharacterized protein n=1 Tax=Natronocella acetinitrilica TaxID=414046 RepID=A0AAE3G3T3_9GAMM|nr:hypothetical protein [Natronocella acetinitrilica]MCP1674216.1 hypothetical protein [Natronocella acetinitrilica]